MRLFRFRYSCYARKVQGLLELTGTPFEIVEVPYADRSAMLEAAGRYAYVPVLVADDGRVLRDSRDIAAALVEGDERFGRFVPDEQAGPVWAYADWIDVQLEDVMFRIASPGIRDRFATENERVLFAHIKERKYGPGVIEQWAREQELLVKKARALLGPTRRTLARAPFLCGPAPTLADACLYGQLTMVQYARPQLGSAFGDEIAAWYRRLLSLGASPP
jgi:glutathione S-transferase